MVALSLRPVVVFLMFLSLCCLRMIYREASWFTLLLAPHETAATADYEVITTGSQMKSLYPGELPGYTGWLRPATTLAGSFFVHHPCLVTSQVNREWTCSVQCSHEDCRQGGSLFYVRAYGPAILPGLVTDHQNGTYDVIFLPMDEGLYTVEVVLTFSHPPPFSQFPLESFTEPVYEGYMLPDFPLLLSVIDQESSGVVAVDPLPLCTMADMFESSPTSAIRAGRWLVKEKMIMRPFSLSNQNKDASFDGYQRGENSLGIHMEYRPTKCSLVEESALKGSPNLVECAERDLRDRNRRLHIILAGDSNMRLQAQVLERENFLGLASSFSFLDFHYGLNSAMSFIKSTINEILSHDAQYDVATDYIIVFNSGLHDIINLCGSEYWGLTIDFEVRGDARCADTYRRKLTELTQMLQQQFPSLLIVFQTTHAAWPKWGNYGIGWPVNGTQPLPYASDFVHYFNQIAWDVIRSAGIPIIDTYWLTLSRPDHRESHFYALQHKMVHAGPEVYSILTRQWVMMILETLCKK